MSAGFSQLISLATLAGTFLGATSGARAQPSHAFEVASIKPSRNSGEESNINSGGGRLTATNITVRELIRLAFGVKDYQIARAPAWIDKNGYDIAAENAAVATKVSYDDLQSMVRRLLADRFQLTAHREAKEAPMYLLVVGKNGPKLTPHNDGAGSGTRKACGHLAGKRLTVDTIATVLSREFERDVINRTGLPGKYDFQLDWTPDSGPCATLPDSEGSVNASTYTPDRPSIFAAIQEQLGLRLEASRGPAEILIIDHVERPSEN
jgi:uncharacterized protein (TIGR03435 family)